MRKPALNTANTRLVSLRAETIHWDTEVPKLGLRRRGATRSWIVQWRADGRSRKQSLGRADAIPLPQARELARALLNGLEVGAVQNASLTVTACCRRYLKDLAPSWKPATRRANRHDADGLIVPHLGSKRLTQPNRPWAGSHAWGNRKRVGETPVMIRTYSPGLIP